jgi:ABC-type multidrug transport system ATPase subunit
MTERPPRLAVEGLRKVYQGGFGLHGVDLEVAAGCIVALGGPNGSGKSTFLKCVAGLVRHEGSVRLDGRALDGSPANRDRIGYLPQTVGMPEHATVGEMLDLFAALRGTDRTSVPLPEGFVRPDDVRIGALSGGQRHRVALAIALLGGPTLLLLDEPVANLDEEGRGVFWAVLRRLRDERGVSAIVSSPAPSELRRVADRGITMEDGRVALDEGFAGTPFAETAQHDLGDLEAAG